VPAPSDLSIAPATEEDVDEIHAIEREAFGTPWKRDFFVLEILETGRFNLVARRAGRMVGYFFAMWYLDEMHVNKIAVAGEARRQGVAAALMEAAEEFAHEHAVTVISLEVRQSNRGAQDFYASIGFESAYRRPRYYPDGEPAVIMVKQL
jgi:ribosomal-protein-alanine N-acetyltransferase